MRTDLSGAECSIAQSLDVVGDWWTLLVVRDIARGRTRFEELQAELGVSRKVLTERLNKLVDNGVLERVPYQTRPVRNDYLLTMLGNGLLPVLAALQDWGDRFLLGDGTVSATTDPGSAEAKRVHALKGTTIPLLPDIEPIEKTPWTVLYFYPGTGVSGPEWKNIPGAVGCTLESCTYRDRLGDFATVGASVKGVSTQRPLEQAEFAKANRIRFPLLSDADLELTMALRLPTFRADGVLRIKRLTLVADADRVIRFVQYPIPDVTGSVDAALSFVQKNLPKTGPVTPGERAPA